MNAMKSLLFLLLVGMMVQSSDLTEVEKLREKVHNTTKRLDNEQRKHENSLNQLLQKERPLKLVGDQIGKKYCHKMNFALNSIDVPQVVESFLLPQETLQMKSTCKRLNKLKITGKLSLFPTENSVQVFRDMDFFAPKNEITWEDPNNLISNERKENMEKCLRLAENERSNCLFDEVSEWNSVADRELYPFCKEVLFAVLNSVDLERRKRGHRILMRNAIEFNAPKDVARLVERKRDVNLEETIPGVDFKPLVYAASFDRLEIVKILLEAGADVNGPNIYGSTPLKYATSIEMVTVLLEKNAEVNTSNKWGRTPLHQIAGIENVEVIKIILKAGADVNALCEDHQTPLHRAALFGRAENVKILLKWGAKVDSQDSQGRTALILAARHGRIEIVKILEFETAAQIEEQHGYHDCDNY